MPVTNSPTIDSEKTQVLHGFEKTTEAIIRFLYSTEDSMNICADHTWPSVAMGVEVFKKGLGAIELLKKLAAEHDVNVRVITPTSDDVEKILQNRASIGVIKEQKENQKKEKGFEVLCHIFQSLRVYGGKQNYMRS